MDVRSGVLSVKEGREDDSSDGIRHLSALKKVKSTHHK